MFCMNEVASINVAFYDDFLCLEGCRLYRVVSQTQEKLMQATEVSLSDTVESIYRIARFLETIAERLLMLGNRLKYKDRECFEVCEWLALWLNHHAKSYRTYKRIDLIRSNEREKLIVTNVINIATRAA